MPSSVIMAPVKHVMSPIILLTICAAAQAQDMPAIKCDGIYCRETEDRAWHVQVTGKITSLAGLYVLVHDADARLIFKGALPAGNHPKENPARIEVPADGRKGDYLVTFLGDMRHIRGPFTDLPKEVYGGRSFMALPYGAKMPPAATGPGNLFFQAPKDTNALTISGGGARWQIHTMEGNVAYDVRTQGVVKVNKRNGNKSYVGTFTGQPGTTYVLRRWMMYFYIDPRCYLTLTPTGWFEPDPRLAAVKWWRHVD